MTTLITIESIIKKLNEGVTGKHIIINAKNNVQLIGGKIYIKNPIICNGNLTIVSISSPIEIDLKTSKLTNMPQTLFNDILFTSSAPINVYGNLELYASTIELSKTKLFIDNENINGQNRAYFQVNSLIMNNSSDLTLKHSSGNVSAIINAKDSVILESNSYILSLQSGDINIIADIIDISENSKILAVGNEDSYSRAFGGNISLTANVIELEGYLNTSESCNGIISLYAGYISISTNQGTNDGSISTININDGNSGNISIISGGIIDMPEVSDIDYGNDYDGISGGNISINEVIFLLIMKVQDKLQLIIFAH